MEYKNISLSHDRKVVLLLTLHAFLCSSYVSDPQLVLLDSPQTVSESFYLCRDQTAAPGGNGSVVIRVQTQANTQLPVGHNSTDTAPGRENKEKWPRTQTHIVQKLFGKMMCVCMYLYYKVQTVITAKRHLLM